MSTADRCDRCNAQAFVRVVLANGELTFCGHHAKALEPRLREQALEWIDETSQLT